MGESELTTCLSSEAELIDYAGEIARRWHASRDLPLRIALRGDLGAGKTTWARGMLRGLGHTGRVPSPTFTLLEQYSVDGRPILHLDLYRLGSPDEIQNLGIRDWLDDDCAWILLEWPDRVPALRDGCDLVLTLDFKSAEGRRVTLRAATPNGHRALRLVSEMFPSKTL